MTHEVPRMGVTSYKDEPDKGVTKVHMAVRDPPPQTRRWSESSWDGLGVETEGRRMSALARLRDMFTEHVQPNPRLSNASTPSSNGP